MSGAKQLYPLMGAQQGAADAMAAGMLTHHQGGDPAGGGAQRQVIHEIERQ